MTQLIFINLPVADLDRSVAFYEAVGATKNPMFSDETAACMVLSDVINVMLLTHDKWRSFTDRAIPDAQVSAQMLLCLSREDKAAVDATVAQAAGAVGVLLSDRCGNLDALAHLLSRSFFLAARVFFNQ